MITQEMVDAIRNAIKEDSGGHALTNMVGDKLWWTDKPVNLTEILRAVYPLILEQAAGVCDDIFEIANAKSKNNIVHVVASEMAKEMGKEIRNLKDKTDEAHNG